MFVVDGVDRVNELHNIWLFQIVAIYPTFQLIFNILADVFYFGATETTIW